MKNWVLLTVIGILAIIAGILALIYPLPLSLTVDIFVGWAFLILGILQVMSSFGRDAWIDKIWTFLLGFLAGFLGLTLLVNPLEGVVALTLVASIIFIAAGIFKFILGWSVKDKGYRFMLLFLGTMSIIVGGMIMSGFPDTSKYTLGVLLGIELISAGITVMVLGLASKDNNQLLSDYD